IGLGYVGLPVACIFAKAGLDVIGADVFTERVEKINAGISPIEGNEPGLNELVREVAGSSQMRATIDYEQLRDRDVILIDVQTPVDENHKPHYEALRASLQSLGPVLKKGALVIVESTISPGTMNKLALPLLEESSGLKLNEGFYLGNCPERVMPGKLLQNLKSLSRVVGGMTPETADTMVALYRLIVDGDLDPTDCTTAELVKTVENAYRDVQIAFANEVALVSEAVGGDVWKVRELVNKSPGRNMLLPGAGVGGHCIPKDPWLLADAVDGLDVPLRLIPAARAVNDAMPQHVADLLSEALEQVGKNLRDAKILVMGIAYLEDSDDTRNSPSEALVALLKAKGAKAVVHDPYVDEYKGDLLMAAKGCDAAVLMVKHAEYLALDIVALRAALSQSVLVDGRGFFDVGEVRGMGFIYHGIGTA
ncbi:MAG: nucleotide sugar dehydrogenase, partial [Chloroflexi bacterium]|nr:nucleotide sugar dehydrogenase [Chloroflexota bacterium]